MFCGASSALLITMGARASLKPTTARSPSEQQTTTTSASGLTEVICSQPLRPAPDSLTSSSGEPYRTVVGARSIIAPAPLPSKVAIRWARQQAVPGSALDGSEALVTTIRRTRSEEHTSELQ